MLELYFRMQILLRISKSASDETQRRFDRLVSSSENDNTDTDVV